MTRRLRPLGRALVVLSLIAGLGVVAAPASYAAVNCETSGTTLTITSNANDTIRLVRFTSRLHVYINGSLDLDCEVRLSEITTILVRDVSASASQTVNIDLSNGGGDGFDDKLFRVELGGGQQDTLIITGSGGEDQITLGSSGGQERISLDTDVPPAHEVEPTGVEFYEVNAAGGNDVVRGDAGAGTGDVAFPSDVTLTGASGSDNLAGGAGDDIIDGGAGGNILEGGAGDDSFQQGVSRPTTEQGHDEIDGGADTDVVDYSQRTNALTVTIDGPGGEPDGESGELDDISTTVEEVLGGSANDSIAGSSGSNTLWGNAGDDALSGGSGSDVLHGGPGDDTLNGGNGNDVENGGPGDDRFNQGSSSLDPTNLTANGNDELNGGVGIDHADYGARRNQLFVTLDGNANDGEGDESDNVGVDVENVTGGSATDTIQGSSAANTLAGGAGNDTIHGLGGPDQIDGATGDDELHGGGGNDVITGGPDSVTAPTTDEDILRGDDGDDILSGGAQGDSLAGGAGEDELDGGPGNDSESGEEGNDIFLQGEAANGGDALSGGPGTDTVDYSLRTTRVVVTVGDGNANDGDPAVGTPTPASEGDNIQIDVENIDGGAGNDTITGSASANVLSGNAGNDRLAGGDGNDTLNGGDGNDLFDEGSSPNGGDVVNGGAGAGDTVNYVNRAGAIVVSRDGEANDGQSGENDNVKADVEFIGPSPTTTFRTSSVPEGATVGGFKTFLLLSNPGASTASVDLTLMTRNGPLAPAELQGIQVGPGRRVTKVLDTRFGQIDVATKMYAFGGPVVLESSVQRAGSLATMDMIGFRGDPDFSQPSPEYGARTWILPEGATHSGFTTFVTIGNPNATDARVDVTFLRRTGGSTTRTGVVVPAGGRTTLNVRNECNCTDDVSTRVAAQGGENPSPGVVAAVSLHRNAGGDLGIGGSLGVTSTAAKWVVAEGATHSGWATFILIANPTTTAAEVQVEYLTPQGKINGGTLAVPAGSRRTISANKATGSNGCGCAADVSTIITATTGTVAVESSVQKIDGFGFVIGDSVGSGGGDLSSATGRQWLAAEGASHSGFTTFILIANPDPSASATIDLTFLTKGGGASSPASHRCRTVAAGQRCTINVGRFVTDDVSTLVESNVGVVVEMAIDRVSSQGFSKGRSLAARLG